MSDSIAATSMSVSFHVRHSVPDQKFESSMSRIELNRVLYFFDQFCPFCGQQVLGGGDDGFAKEYPHTVCFGPADE